MKRILNSFVCFILTQSGPTDPNMDMYSFLIALFFSLVHLLCLLLSLLLSFDFVHSKGQYFLKYINKLHKLEKEIQRTLCNVSKSHESHFF